MSAQPVRGTVLGAVAIAVLLVGGAAWAQTPTPTGPAPACEGGKKLRLIWKASTREAKVLVRLKRCPPPSGCDGGATPLIAAPLSLLLEGAGGRRILAPLPVQDYVKSDFCPGGHETFELERGKLRYIFGSEGVTGVALNAVTVINDPPLLSSPVRFRLADANGYALETIFADCDVRQSDAIVQVSCSDTTRYRDPSPTAQPTATSNAGPTRTPIPTRTPAPTRTPLG